MTEATRRPRPQGRTLAVALASAVAMLGAGAVLLEARPAGAQTATTTGGPIQIEADSVDIRPQDRVVFLSGNAVVIQNGNALRSNTLRVTYRGEPGADGSQIDKVFADTEVFYITPNERVRGDNGVFDATNNTITIRGRVVVTQGRSVVQGSELVVNTVTRQSRMRSVDGRVRAVFFQNPQARSGN